jgi:hypothetical protein
MFPLDSILRFYTAKYLHMIYSLLLVNGTWLLCDVLQSM